MSAKTLNAAETFAALPPAWSEDLLPQISEAVTKSKQKLVVLDDDPTGTQTVYDVPVYTTWDEATLRAALSGEAQIFYILTNSRSLPEPEAADLARDLGTNLRRAVEATGQAFSVVSRSDSTLRGHYPLETDALADALGQFFDATLIIPAFFEGGRYTLNDVHYVKQGDDLVPAAETPFAKDASFGYSHSNLTAWVEEKTKGKVRAEDVVSVTLEDLRKGGPDAVRNELMSLSDDAVRVVNAASYRDLEVFVLGLLQAEAAGRHFLYRTAASFVRTRAGLQEKPLLTRDDFNLSEQAGGLVMVGSYVPLSTEQLKHLLEHTESVGLELNVANLLDDTTASQEITLTAQRADELLRQGRTVVIYTSRELVKAEGTSANLDIGKRVSNSLIAILQAIGVRPSFLVAKGGITSSDLATKGLGVKKAMVKGQVLPGIPVWQLGDEAKFAGLEYIVFPGNVGKEEALSRIVEMLHRDVDHGLKVV